MINFSRKYFSIFLLLIVFIIAGCASNRKNPWLKERKKSGYVSTSRLGKNKYYFSNSYQKKLNRSIKKK